MIHVSAKGVGGDLNKEPAGLLVKVMKGFVDEVNEKEEELKWCAWEEDLTCAGLEDFV